MSDGRRACSRSFSACCAGRARSSLLLIGTIVLGDQLSPAFLKSGNFFYIGLNIGEVAIIALPLALIVITGEIDLSVASMLGLSGHDPRRPHLARAEHLALDARDARLRRARWASSTACS